ncbi:ammonium transporter [Streptococcus cameli]
MFQLICILVMWLMIFGVGFFYIGFLHPSCQSAVLFRFTLALMVASLVWLGGGHFLAFGEMPPFFWELEKVAGETLLDCFFQLCFLLYAVVMLIGSVIDRIPIWPLVAIVAAWVMGVYIPLAYLIWNESGFLAQFGVLDFSGGLVVHLSAGLSALVLAKKIGKTAFSHDPIRTEWLYLGMLLVTVGWFGFNAGPVGEWNQDSMVILINTLLALLIGGISWGTLAYLMEKKQDLSALLNGMVVGLVTSTAGVGFVTPLQMLITVALTSSLTYLAYRWCQKHWYIDDVVDSFAINGIGGFLGSVTILLLYPDHLLAQLMGILVTIFLSLLGTGLFAQLFFTKKKQ